MPAGSLQEWAFTFTIAAPFYGPSTPYPITGATWEYVVRANATDVGTPLIDITTTPTSAGLITVTSTGSLSQVLLAIYPPATATLTPGSFYHALWMWPGNSTSAFTWVTGQLVVQGNPQP